MKYINCVVRAIRSIFLEVQKTKGVSCKDCNVNMYLDNSYLQYSGSGSKSESTCFWASWIRVGSTSHIYGSGSFYHQANIVRKALIPTVKSGNFVTFSHRTFFSTKLHEGTLYFFWQ
jgi:hypothetical protein